MISVLRVLHREEMQEIQKKYDVIVVGLGVTGMSCLRYLMKNDVKLAVADTRSNPPQLENLKKEFPDITFYHGDFNEELLCTADLLIVSPGVPLASPVIQTAISNGVKISGDIELFLKEAKAPVVAITGSNGKSTVAKLVSEMISTAGKNVQLGGNFGTPALALLESDVPDFYVLELSSFQLELIDEINAVASTVLNVSEDHMDRYGSFQDYVLAKKKILMGNGIKVVNIDDPVVTDLVEPDQQISGFTLAKTDHASFGINRINNRDWICLGDIPVLTTADLQISGRHNLLNVLASLALGHAIGLKLDDMAKSLKKFKGLAHRCESILKVNNVEWINDSKGTNPGATCAAIEGLATGENIVLIAGGDSKGADLTSLGKAVAGRVHTAILMGKDAGIVEQAISSNCQIIHATSMEGAVNAAKRVARSGDKVLLSPACSSLDMFADYRERGDSFSFYARQMADPIEGHRQ